ncbi:hypothetical protein [Brevundimonas sp.]|uniref:DUF6998 domain-containing protein n=1 Tax=Brevundimonas sp. TaxID=1871086 RepID=UPI003567CCC2
MNLFDLPPLLEPLVEARNRLRNHYQAAGLTFTFDGKLVGDLGEAIAAEVFGLKLKSGPGIDGHAPDGRSVQVKTSTTGRGPAYRRVDTTAQHLLFFQLDLEARKAAVVFNGPEHIALACLPDTWDGRQRMISLPRLKAANALVRDDERLRPVAPT